MDPGRNAQKRLADTSVLVLIPLCMAITAIKVSNNFKTTHISRCKLSQLKVKHSGNIAILLVQQKRIMCSERYTINTQKGACALSH